MVTGAALARDEARLTILGVPDRPGVVHAIFREIAAANIVVDMIVQNVATEGTTEVSFTVASGDLAETLRTAESAARAIGASGVTHDAGVAKVSVVGMGMRTHTGVARLMFEALAASGINIAMITTSEIKISVLVDRAVAVPALRAVHRAFQLEQAAGERLEARSGLELQLQQAARAKGVPPTGENGNGPAAGGAPAAPASATPGMEDLVISGVELDEVQARITLFDVPDQPGYAARVFTKIADAGIFVDMIVQNVSTAGNTHLSFTVPRDVAERAAGAVSKLGPGEVSVEPDLAKLSVMGVGMRTHTGVATRMFGALAERGINIVLINTSEVRINVATDISRGREGLACLRSAFDLPDSG
jgi:aspartate kinase